MHGAYIGVRMVVSIWVNGNNVFPNFEGDDFRIFLLYAALFVLQDIPPDCFNSFMCLHQGISLILQIKPTLLNILNTLINFYALFLLIVNLCMGLQF